ncbi:MAG TPA: FGGY-family carbohydrate kinase, partial [Actinomycetota bacterium]|nr:FGGY-family carbohydrate kinase [Actinomycetota bacterium]
MASDAVVLGIDQGSSGARAAVMTAAGDVLGSGRVACDDLRRTPHGSEHDPAAWLEESFRAARAALEASGRSSVDAIGVGALGPAPVVLDDDLEPLVPSPLFPITPVPEWVRGLPSDVVDRAAWVVDVTGFLVSALVGRPVIDRITAADHIVDATSAVVPVPEPIEPLDVAGGLGKEGAELLGLPPDVPVVAGTYDTFVDLAGVGVGAIGEGAIMLGSTAIVGVVRDEPDAPEGLRASPHVGLGWFVGGWTSAAGRALAWVASLAPSAERARIVAEAGAMSPGSAGVLGLPSLDGERAPIWDPAARGALIGLTTDTTLVGIYRGMLDGVVLSTADLAARLEPVSGDVAWLVAGGGVRDGAWLQATADALGESL